MVNEQFVVDDAGNRNAVLMGVDRYFELLEAEEELECIRAFDEAKSSDEESIPFEIAIAEIEDDRR
ncbi:MAG: hypothetical protein ACRD6X_07960 [Pyrinomonadaceae bacterium]